MTEYKFIGFNQDRFDSNVGVLRLYRMHKAVLKQFINL